MSYLLILSMYLQCVQSLLNMNFIKKYSKVNTMIDARVPVPKIAKSKTTLCTPKPFWKLLSSSARPSSQTTSATLLNLLCNLNIRLSSPDSISFMSLCNKLINISFNEIYDSNRNTRSLADPLVETFSECKFLLVQFV